MKAVTKAELIILLLHASSTEALREGWLYALCPLPTHPAPSSVRRSFSEVVQLFLHSAHCSLLTLRPPKLSLTTVVLTKVVAKAGLTVHSSITHHSSLTLSPSPPLKVSFSTLYSPRRDAFGSTKNSVLINPSAFRPQPIAYCLIPAAY